MDCSRKQVISSFRFRILSQAAGVTLALVMAHCLTVPAPAQETLGRNRSAESIDPKAQKPKQEKEYIWEELLNKNPAAIENEKKYFDRVTDPKLKQRVASILVGVGVKDRIYLDYLVVAARKSLKDDTPWPTLYDEDGTMNTKATNPVFVEWMKKRGLDSNDERFAAIRQYSPSFLDWCEKNQREPNQASYDAYYVISDPWYYLAAAGDPRAYDLLIQGLRSHNLMIVAEAAQGLAKLQDARAIPELIAIGRQVPGEARLGIAWSLLYFADPKAQLAAEELATDKGLLHLYRDIVKEKGVKALFPW